MGLDVAMDVSQLVQRAHRLHLGLEQTNDGRLVEVLERRRFLQSICLSVCLSLSLSVYST